MKPIDPDTVVEPQTWSPTDQLELPIELEPPKFSDDAVAARFAEEHANHLRYVAAWRRWFLWDGPRWVRDEKLRTSDLARLTCRVAAKERRKLREQQQMASLTTISACERSAMTDPRLAATTDQWEMMLSS